MEFYNDIISIVISNGVFAILFVWLFFYQLKDSNKRERKYQDTIENLTQRLQIVDDMKDDIKDIKDFLTKGENEYEELL